MIYVLDILYVHKENSQETDFSGTGERIFIQDVRKDEIVYQ